MGNFTYQDTVIIITLLIVVRVLVAVRLSPPEEQLHLCADVAAAMEEAEPGLPLHSSLGAYGNWKAKF